MVRASDWSGVVASLVLCFALALAAPAAAKRHGRGDTGVVDVSQSPGLSEGEEPLVANPFHPRQLLAVANVFQPNAPPPLDKVFGGGGLQDTRVYVSRDGGRHWTTRKLDQGGIGELPSPLPEAAGFAPEFSDFLNILNTDASAGFDRRGNAYFASGDIHGIHHNLDEQANVWRSTDAGRIWTPPSGYTAVSALQEGAELDRPWLTVDNSGGPRDGTLYMTFETTPFLPTPAAVYVKSSSDQGRTWSDTVRVDDGFYSTQFNPRARPAVGAGGTLNVVYARAPITVTPFLPQNAPIQLVLARSTDGGQSFERFVADADVHRVSSPDEALPAYTEMIPAIAADPRHRGRVAVAWPEADGDGNSRIMLRYSRDGGDHWGPRIDVADDPGSVANQHDHVTLDWLANGPLFVGWRDHRCCGGGFDTGYQQWVRALWPRHGRLVPRKTVEFTDGPDPAGATEGRGVLEPDEFQGLAATRIGVGLTWSSLQGKYDELMFRRVPLAAFGVARPRR